MRRWPLKHRKRWTTWAEFLYFVVPRGGGFPETLPEWLTGHGGPWTITGTCLMAGKQPITISCEVRAQWLNTQVCFEIRYAFGQHFSDQIDRVQRMFQELS